MNDTTFIWPPHSHATQGVHFIDTLDQHRPRLATARSGGLLTRWLVGYGGLRLLPHPTRLVRVPTVITNQVRALGRYVLCELGEKIQGREDLKVAIHSRSYSISLRIGKGAPVPAFRPGTVEKKKGDTAWQSTHENIKRHWQNKRRINPLNDAKSPDTNLRDCARNLKRPRREGCLRRFLPAK